MGTGGLMDRNVEELLINWGQAIVFCISFVMLVVQITPSIK
jgi:hypothetical protein